MQADRASYRRYRLGTLVSHQQQHTGPSLLTACLVGCLDVNKPTHTLTHSSIMMSLSSSENRLHHHKPGGFVKWAIVAIDTKKGIPPSIKRGVTFKTNSYLFHTKFNNGSAESPGKTPRRVMRNPVCALDGCTKRNTSLRHLLLRIPSLP
ncbi:hypothetical protein B0T10DRAFT_33649 [Thelonectria olida]|uniref:Uncharacterized protein n=1 Tax=Thelonectria olida TaxID=1576542 RepID=A0A9P8WJK6_9HYPO|nr:hypothetical protein B0T10DRAFT_33649 [Thelonectria olida]